MKLLVGVSLQVGPGAKTGKWCDCGGVVAVHALLGDGTGSGKRGTRAATTQTFSCRACLLTHGVDECVLDSDVQFHIKKLRMMMSTV
mmetsp:Transcript_80509/g.210024  ORF Transcript_80509/g.210024 Transcript_80509/m.210024 type:complete len:87 (-) Transcript_80509:70-330(-)